MSHKINALDLRKHFGEVMDKVRYDREPYIVTKNGRPSIVLVDIETYESSKKNFEEELFIEKYTEERIAEFLKEDAIDAAALKKVRQSLDK